MTELAPDLAPTTEQRLLQGQDAVRSFCGWHIAPSRTEDLEVEGSGGTVLALPSMHVTAVTAIVDEQDRPVTGWRFRRNGLLMKTSGSWPTGALTVSLTHGYPDVPADVTGVVQAVAQRAGDNPTSRQSTTSGPFTDNYGAPIGTMGLYDEEQQRLAAYRVQGLP